MDLILKDGTVVTPDGEFRAAIAIDEGKIVAIGSESVMHRAERVLELKGLHVLPGVIDAHVHFRDPGMTYKEDFLTGTSAAAAGGVTTVLEMPNTIPTVSTTKTLLDKASTLKGRAHVDYGLYGAIVEDNVDELPEMAKAGAIGFKVCLAEITGDVPRPSNGCVFEAFKAAAKTNLPVAAHAEDSSVVQYYVDRASSSEPIAHCKARPPIAEAEGIQMLTLLASKAGNRIHMVHTSSSTEVIEAAKLRGVNVTAETCPQYLVFSEEDMSKGAFMKINPPLRSKQIVRELIGAVKNGIIDAMGSDHAPHAVEEKKRDNIWEVASGNIGVETLVPVMLTLVNQGVITLTRFVEMTSENPAKIFNLYPKKGAISVGSDADFTVVDLKSKKRINAEELHSKNKISPFDGWDASGTPVYTIVRGKVVADHGGIAGRPGGKLIKPILGRTAN